MTYDDRTDRQKRQDSKVASEMWANRPRRDPRRTDTGNTRPNRPEPVYDHERDRCYD